MQVVATIDPTALQHNLAVARSAAASSRVLAVIKADGYGHGLLSVAKALADADGFAVARCEEGVALRQGGYAGLVLILGGFCTPEEAQLASRERFHCAVHDDQQLHILAHSPLERPLSVWLKIDSGMHRLGFPPRRGLELLQQLQQCPQVGDEVRLMTHFANADDCSDSYTRTQIDTFLGVVGELPIERSMANSAALLGWPAARADWARPGIMLYGCSPFADGVGSELGLRPVMTVETRLIASHWLRPGDPIGYGGTWRCPAKCRVGVAAVGYGDGYPRHLPSGTPVLVDGNRAPLLGRVSMDTICVDITAIPQASVGSKVVVWGNGLPVEEIARAANTIPYELLCRLTPRVRRIVARDSGRVE